MKKFLLIFFLILSVGASNSLLAQCSVTNIIIDPVSQTQIGPNVEVVLNVQFTTTTNGGNKQVFFHVWRETQYPEAKMHPTPFNCTGNQSVGPRPASGLGDNANHIDILDQAFINFGFNVNAVSTFPTFSTAGINTSYFDWDGSGTVSLNFVGATISKQPTGNADEDIIRIANLKFTVPNYLIGDFLQVRAFNWATNGTGGKPQCWGCGYPFVIGDPIIGGSVLCPQPGGGSQPKYSLIINSKYDDPATLGTQTIQGKYTLYADDGSGMLEEAEDLLVKNETNFSTSLVGVPIGFNSSYVISGASFDANLPAGFSGKVFAKVIVSTTGYLGAGVVGELTNNCGPLPVSFKSFNATIRSGKGALAWETAMETNNSGFEIQRRGASGQYEKIGFVDSKAPNGTGAAYSYSFDDNLTLPKGVTYYRLRQVDLDGRATYSEVKAVRAGNSQLVISIYPNPNRGTANVAIPESAGKMDVSLDDFTGKSIQRWNGINVRNLQINNMKPGIYMLRINLRETGEIITERIVVQ